MGGAAVQYQVSLILTAPVVDAVFRSLCHQQRQLRYVRRSGLEENKVILGDKRGSPRSFSVIVISMRRLAALTYHARLFQSASISSPTGLSQRSSEQWSAGLSTILVLIKHRRLCRFDDVADHFR